MYHSDDQLILHAIDSVAALEGAGVIRSGWQGSQIVRESKHTSRFTTLVLLDEVERPPTDVPGQGFARPPVTHLDRPIQASLATTTHAGLQRPRVCACLRLAGSTTTPDQDPVLSQPLLAAAPRVSPSIPAWGPVVSRLVPLIRQPDEVDIAGPPVRALVDALFPPAGPGRPAVPSTGMNTGSQTTQGTTQLGGSITGLATSGPPPTIGQFLLALSPADFRSLADALTSWVLAKVEQGRSDLRRLAIAGDLTPILQARALSNDDRRAIQHVLGQVLGFERPTSDGLIRDVRIEIVQAGA